MNRMSASRVPPPPDAPQCVHDRFVETVRRELEDLAAEEHQRRLDAALRTGAVDLVAGEEWIRELEELVKLAAAADEANWQRVREAAKALLARQAG